jgi:hypothetical protein
LPCIPGSPEASGLEVPPLHFKTPDNLLIFKGFLFKLRDLLCNLGAILKTVEQQKFVPNTKIPLFF